MAVTTDSHPGRALPTEFPDSQPTQSDQTARLMANNIRTVAAWVQANGTIANDKSINPAKRMKKYANRMQLASERAKRLAEANKLATELWKRLTTAVGHREAKEIMRAVIGGKKPGPTKSDEETALTLLIYYSLIRGDKQIASRIVNGDPYYLKYESGQVLAYTTELNEVTLEDNPAVGRCKINKSLAALKKQVERVRRETLNDDLLPKEFAPKPYYRD
jgi:hypothetical protein